MKTLYVTLAFLLVVTLTGLAIATAMLPDDPIRRVPARTLEMPATYPAAW
jgi:Tfp pilus assembly protein PilX